MARERYFDYAAACPPHEEALKEYVVHAKNQFANPSSLHREGKSAKKEMLELKRTFCDMLHFYDGRMLLTSSGSEANNTIIEGHIREFSQAKLLIAEDVHESIWYATQKYPKSIKILKIDKNGEIPFDRFTKVLKNDISLVCLNHASNETGVIHPIREMAEYTYQKGIRTLIDGMQSVGHIPVNLNEIPCTYYSFSGHKFGAPKSTGGVLIRDNKFSSLIQGGKQEWGLRAGTEDLAGLTAMVSALSISLECMDSEMNRLGDFKEKLSKELGKLPNVKMNSQKNGLPGLLSISVSNTSGSELVSALSQAGFSLSTGSACHENQFEPSRILMAIGRSEKEAAGSLRISMGFETTGKSVSDLLAELTTIINRI